MGDQDIGSLGRAVSSGLQVPVELGHCQHALVFKLLSPRLCFKETDGNDLAINSLYISVLWVLLLRN